MAKVIEVNMQNVSIGMDDGTIEEVLSSSLNFVPHIGDEVEIFRTAEKLIVSKKTSSGGDNPNYININVDNSSNNSSNNSNTNATYAAPSYGTPVYLGKPVNKFAYLLLCFFGGAFGLHKFYVGKVAMGLCYLLFSWSFVPFVCAFFDFFGALFRGADPHGYIYF